MVTHMLRVRANWSLNNSARVMITFKISSISPAAVFVVTLSVEHKTHWLAGRNFHGVKHRASIWIHHWSCNHTQRNYFAVNSKKNSWGRFLSLC